MHKFLRDARHITIEGVVIGTSASNRNTMCDALVTALEAIEQADGTYTWTSDGADNSLTVRSEVPVVFSGSEGPLLKRFSFGLIAADPEITVTPL